jgi:2'-5' RNA ligase
MRAFFSLPVPLGVAQSLLTLVPPIRGLRKSRADSVHLTLAFLADAPADLAGRIELADLPKPFRLIPGKFILLPESGPVSVVAASLTGDVAQLRQLHERVAQALLVAGVEPPADAKRFLPHLTLARASPPLPQQLRSQTPMEPREDLSFEVSELVLTETVPAEGGTPGVRHVRIRSWALK